MIAFALALAVATGANDVAVSAAVDAWRRAVQSVRSQIPKDGASEKERLQHLILLDEVTRQNLWIMDDPNLTPDQQQRVGLIIGTEMSAIDEYNTRVLKTLLPKSGWFDNHTHGKQITHGAWLIAQHSPDREFMKYALVEMEKRVSSGGVDARDYALTYDRVRIGDGYPQRYGSQFSCRNGRLSLMPVEDEAAVDTEREKIGWSQTLAETKGDNEIGKPCVQ